MRTNDEKIRYMNKRKIYISGKNIRLYEYYTRIIQRKIERKYFKFFTKNKEIS